MGIRSWWYSRKYRNIPVEENWQIIEDKVEIILKLEEILDKRAIKTLIGILDEAEGGVNKTAADALLKAIVDDKTREFTIESIMNVLKKSGDFDVRTESIAYLIRRMVGKGVYIPNTLSYLNYFLESMWHDTQKEAVHALKEASKNGVDISETAPGLIGIILTAEEDSRKREINETLENALENEESRMKVVRSIVGYVGSDVLGRKALDVLIKLVVIKGHIQVGEIREMMVEQVKKEKDVKKKIEMRKTMTLAYKEMISRIGRMKKGGKVKTVKIPERRRDVFRVRSMRG